MLFMMKLLNIFYINTSLSAESTCARVFTSCDFGMQGSDSYWLGIIMEQLLRMSEASQACDELIINLIIIYYMAMKIKAM